MVVAGLLLAHATAVNAADQDREQDRDRVQLQDPSAAQDRDRDRDRIQDRDIYGYQLMTEQERNTYRERMRNAATAEERNRIRAEHHEQMKMRAKERGMKIPDEPPARPGHMGNDSMPMGPGGGGRR
jgi:hypothetical protein